MIESKDYTRKVGQNAIRSTLGLREDINHFEIVDQNEGETGGESGQSISILNHQASKSRKVGRTGDRELLNAARKLGYLPIFLLALEQGLRQRELIALKWSDLDIKNRTLTVHEERVVECEKLVEHDGKTRTIDLPQFTVEQLVQEHKKHPSSEAMFIHPGTLKPYSPEMIRLLHKRVLEQARLEHISFKNLRHTCVIRALERGKDSRMLSAVLGHTRASVTRQGYRKYLLKTGQKRPCAAPVAPQRRK